MSKTIVITGGSDGIGAAAARQLAARGHHLVVVGRSADKTHAVASEVGGDALIVDFSSLDAVRALAAKLEADYPRIDVLANNAGGVLGGYRETEDGYEATFQVNHLAGFLLTNLLLPTLLSSQATVVTTSSIAALLYGHVRIDDLNNRRKYSPNKAYGDTKLENILFTTELHRRFHDKGLNAVCFHPGFIASNFASTSDSFAMKVVYANPLASRLLRTSEQGADPMVWLADTPPGKEWKPGGYYVRRHPGHLKNRQSNDAELAGQLWTASAEMVDL